MLTKMQGQAWVYGDLLDVDDDLCPFDIARGLRERGIAQTEAEMGKYAMIGVDPDFPKKVHKGDFIIGGEAMGYGHDHYHPCTAIKGAGVAAILCDSTNAYFLRNCINHGLPIIECRGITKMVKTGDQLEVDLKAGTVKDVTSGASMKFAPFPQFILDMIEAGGLYPFLGQQWKAGKI